MNYFYQPDIPTGTTTLNPEESNHCIRVLRKKEDDFIHILDGKGGLYLCKITGANPAKTFFEIFEKKQNLPRDYSIHIAIGATKNMVRLEWFVEKSVEIGIDQITFLHGQNSERKILKIDRLQKKAVSALKQSGTRYLPEMNKMVSIKNFINSDFQGMQKFIGHAEAGNLKPLVKNALPGRHYLVLIGPEGDFSQDELLNAVDRGFIPVSLGSSRLRTETAALMACMTLNLINA